jgi:hypothetical protein
MMAVDVETGAAFRAGTARQLFEKAAPGYDVATDGKRFVMVKPVPLTSEATELHLILNWFDDLRRARAASGVKRRCLFPPVNMWARTKSSACSGQEAWGRCIARAIRN